MKSAEIQDQINSIDTAIQQGSSDAQLNVWEMQKSDLKKELETALADEAASNQQQAQVLQIVGLKSTLSSIFEAAFPKDETVKVIGLTEYESTQQTFNQLVDQAVDEDQTALYAAFNTQLEQRDEKFRALTLQALNVQKQLDEAKSLIESQAEELITLDKEIEDHKNTLSIAVDELADRDAEIQRLKDHEFELQKEIAGQAKTAQIIDITPTAPSESLADKIAQAKVASIKQFSNLYSEVTYEGGAKQVVHNSMLPTLEIPVLPTLEPVDNQNMEQSSHTNQVIPSEVPTGNTKGNTTVEGNTDIPQGLGASTKEETPVTLESLHERVKVLEAKAEA